MKTAQCAQARKTLKANTRVSIKLPFDAEGVCLCLVDRTTPGAIRFIRESAEGGYKTMWLPRRAMYSLYDFLYGGKEGEKVWLEYWFELSPQQLNFLID